MKNWSDGDILDYLMTSDLDENLSPEDLRFLLLKFRQFYRVVSTRFTNIEMEKKKYHFDLENLKSMHLSELDQLNQSHDNLLNKYNELMNRKLTLKERFFGKILNK